MKGPADCRRDRLTTATPAEALSQEFIRQAEAVPRCGGIRGWRSRVGTVPAPAGERFPAVAAAFVEVGGEIDQDVEAGHLGVRVTVQITAALRAVSPLWEPRAFFLVTTRPLIIRLRGVIVERHHRVVPVRGQAVPFAVQGGECFLRGLLQPVDELKRRPDNGWNRCVTRTRPAGA